MIEDFPTRLKILNQEWIIKYVSPIPNTEQDCLGLCEIHNNTIYIDTDQSEASMKRILLHEISHSIWHIVPHKLKGKYEEDFCDLVSLMLLDLLNNNDLTFLTT